MRDEDDADAVRRDAAQSGEQKFDLGLRQRRRRLVQHEEAALPQAAGMQPPRDRHQRPVRVSKVADAAIHVDIRGELREGLPRPVSLALPIDPPRRSRHETPGQREIFQNAERRHEPEVLMNEAQPIRERDLGTIGVGQPLAGHPDFRARLGRVEAGETFDEG